MRFLILTQYYPPEVGAPQVRLSAFAQALTRRGHEVDVVTALPNYPQGRIFNGYRGRPAMLERVDGVHVRRLWLHAATGSGMGRVLNYLSFSALAIPGLASMRRPDILFVESPPPTLAVSGWLMAHRWNVPLVLNVSDLWPDSALELGLLGEGRTADMLRRLEAWAYHHADFVTAVTEGIRQTLIERKRLPTEKVLFLPNGVDVDVFRPLPRDDDLADQLGLRDRHLVMVAGTMGYAQGLDVVLGAADLLRERPITFLLVGGGSERDRLKAVASARGLANIRFLEAVAPGQISSLYSIASIALTTLRDAALFDGARPVRTLAAMACATPVVYSGSGEGARMLLEAEAGVVVPPEDPHKLALGITQLLDDAGMAHAMGERGRRFVEANLSWDTLVADWLRTLTQRLTRTSD